MPHIPGKHEVIDVTFKGGRKQSDILNCLLYTSPSPRD